MKSIKNKFLFFFLRVMKDIFNPIQYEISDDLHSQKLGEYYFLFYEKAMENQKGGQKSIVFDKEGIPVNPTYIDVKDKDYVYFPITIGQVGLAVFHTYIQTKSEQDKKRFLKFLKWFKDHAIINERLGARWLTDVALPQYHNPCPWQSAFAQGRAISVLLRGYQMTGDQDLAKLAEQALIAFTLPVHNDGVTSFTKWGPFYEEYTAEEPTLVLNGMMFSLCGLYDFVRVFPEHQLAKKLFDDGVNTLKNCLSEFDIGFWSKYNLCSADWYPKIDPATVTYQHLHVTQLKMLNKLTGEEIFGQYADKFESQINFINIIRMYWKKFKALKQIGRL